MCCFLESQINNFMSVYISVSIPTNDCNIILLCQDVEVAQLHSVHPSSAEVRIIVLCHILKEKL